MLTLRAVMALVRKLVLLCVCAALVACAPIYTLFGFPGHDSATLTRSSFYSGDATAWDVGIFFGADHTPIVTGLKNCGPVRHGIGCALGDVPAKTRLDFTVTGSSVTVYATYYRSGEIIPFTLVAAK